MFDQHSSSQKHVYRCSHAVTMPVSWVSVHLSTKMYQGIASWKWGSTSWAKSLPLGLVPPLRLKQWDISSRPPRRSLRSRWYDHSIIASWHEHWRTETYISKHTWTTSPNTCTTLSISIHFNTFHIYMSGIFVLLPLSLLNWRRMVQVVQTSCRRSAVLCLWPGAQKWHRFPMDFPWLPCCSAVWQTNQINHTWGSSHIVTNRTFMKFMNILTISHVWIEVGPCSEDGPIYKETVS